MVTIMKNRHLPLAAFLFGLSGVPLCFADDKTSEAKPIVVTMKSLSYDPKKLEVHVGDSVAWTNESRTAHSATSDDDAKTFDTGEIVPGKSSMPVKFDKEGKFNYHCIVHGKHMSGTIVVKAVENK